MEKLKRAYANEIIKKYPNSIISADLLANADYDGANYQHYQDLYNQLSERAKDSKYGIKASSRLSSSRYLVVGAVFPPVKGITPDGAIYHYNVNDYAYTLVEFWASWCGPCRELAPQLIALYKEYSPKGFHVIGVSIDTQRESWVRAIVDDELPWEHVSDLEPSSVSRNTGRYNIVDIPANLFNKPKGRDSRC